MTHPRRVYCREWKPKARAIRGTVSLPRLQLITDARPYFECPTCFLFNDKVPVCLWCKSTSQESSTAFWASMPKQRTVSAPMKVNLLDMKVTPCPPPRTRSAEAFYKPSTKLAKPAKPVKPIKPASPPLSRTSSSRASSRISSLTDKSNTYVSGSQHTITMVDGGDVKPAAEESMIEEPGGPPPPVGEGKFHTLPLRRKGHILRTTAGVMVHKSSRLSALFRKDAVPVLDKPPPPPPAPSPPLPEPKPKPRRSIAESTKTAAATMRARRPKRTAPQAPALQTIPSASPLDVRRPSPPTASAAPITSYTVPTPPSFLSPFWYRPEEFGRLPSSSSPPSPTNHTAAGGSLGIPRQRTSPSSQAPPPPRNMHAHSRSEPNARPPPASEARSQAWKRRMSGFIRHSVSVVVGHKAFH